MSIHSSSGSDITIKNASIDKKKEQSRRSSFQNQVESKISRNSLLRISKKSENNSKNSETNSRNLSKHSAQKMMESRSLRI